MPDPIVRNDHDLAGTSRQDLVVALCAVDGASRACATHGDVEVVRFLQPYYAVVAELIAEVGGRVVKVIGDGMLMTFPSARARDARNVLRVVQTRGTELWAALDPECHVVVTLGAGSLIVAPLGPPSDQRPDVYGQALNDLFKARRGEFVTLPAFDALLDV